QINLPIPPGAPQQTTGTTNSTLLVGGYSANDGLVHVAITLNITHTYDADLTLQLISPAGTVVTLAQNLGGSGRNYTNTTFHEKAATSIAAGTPPFTGTFRPQNPLSRFNSENPNGTWTLRVTDSGLRDVGTLVNWSLQLTAGSFQTITQTGNLMDQNA